VAYINRAFKLISKLPNFKHNIAYFYFVKAELMLALGKIGESEKLAREGIKIIEILGEPLGKIAYEMLMLKILEKAKKKKELSKYLKNLGSFMHTLDIINSKHSKHFAISYHSIYKNY